MTQASRRRREMLSERSVLKFCSGRILNWKHKWKLGYSGWPGCLERQRAEKGDGSESVLRREVAGNQRPTGLQRITWQTTFSLIITAPLWMTERTADKEMFLLFFFLWLLSPAPIPLDKAMEILLNADNAFGWCHNDTSVVPSSSCPLLRTPIIAMLCTSPLAPNARAAWHFS